MLSPLTIIRTSAALLCLLGGSGSWANCPAANRFTYSFANAPNQSLDYRSSYVLTASNALGQTQTVTLSFAIDGLSSTSINGIPMPEVSNLIDDGGTTNNNLIVGGTFSGRTTDVSRGTRTVVTRFTFASPVHEFEVQVNDVDYCADQFRDWLQVNVLNGAASYIPTISTPHGNNNSVPGPHSATNSTALIGATTSPLSLTVKQAGGTSTSANNANSGTMTAAAAEPILQAEVRYGNFPLTSGESVTGQQAIGIQTISFCPMPVIGVIKSSTPHVTTASSPERFNIPGADVVYTVTVSNSGGGAVGLNSLVLKDLLPSHLTFRNQDFDDSGPLLTNFEFNSGSSGLSLSAENLAYSADGGSSFAYAPSAGYDTAVNAIRFSPTGSMAANSSFTVKFRAHIK